VGVKIPNFEQNIQEVIQPHEKLCPEVPLAGWDLALTKEVGPCLLEANLSCNFFKGSFDQQWYLEFIHDYFLFCETTEGGTSRSRGDPFERQVSDPQMLVKKIQYGTGERTALEKQAEKGREWKRRSGYDSFERQVSVG
jgi:hypothetical protein